MNQVEIVLHDGTSYVHEVASLAAFKMELSAQVPYIKCNNKGKKEDIFLFKNSIKMIICKESQ